MAASPASAADWFRANTDHFIVYSETSSEEAADFAQELERFDEAMRYLRGIGDEGELPESAKLTVYQFGDTDDIGRLAGQRGVAGFFIPRAGNSVAFVPAKEARQRGRFGTRSTSEDLGAKLVLFHEYAHYFMYQHAAAAYPAWYREGFAEVYGTMDFFENGFRIGNPATHRSFTINELSGYHVERLLDPPEKMTGIDGAQLYGMGWMLSHYLTFSGERQGQLEAYLSALNAGKSSKEAAEAAFGDFDKLNRELDSYRRGRAQGIEVSFPNYQMPDVEVEKLSEAEAARMMLHIKSAAGVEEDEAIYLVDDARKLASAYPDSVPVLLAATEAEYDAKNFDAAHQLATRTISIDPENATAYKYLAGIALNRAKDDSAQFAEARNAFVKANQIDPRDPSALLGYYLSFELADEEAPEDALIALEQAYKFAPFDLNIRTALAHLLLTEDRNSEAIILLGPIINDPHAGKRAKKLRELVADIESGNTSEAISELKPSIDPEDDEEEDA